jgi:ferredoxin-NADP reductase
MARAAVRGRLSWQLTEVVESIEETPRVKSLVLRAPEWSGHRAGQHVDIRLTAEDGYQVQRSYSIASAPEEQSLVLTVERLEDGEVSPYLVDELRPGDQLELRGPIGGYFAWDTSAGGPLLLVGGGSGIVPLMSILRHRVAAGSDAEVRLLASWRTSADIIYAAELERLGELDGVGITHTLTREMPTGWTGRHGRVDEAMLGEVGWAPEAAPLSFVCGPTGLVEAVATGLVTLGHGPERIRTERFGPTGG